VQIKKKRYGYVDKAGNVYDTEDQALYAVHGTLDGIKKSGGVLAENNVSAEDKFFDETKKRRIAKKRSSLVSSSDEASQIIPITDNNTTNQPIRPQQGISSQQAESPSPESVETPSDVDLNIPRVNAATNENTFVVIIANEAYRREASVEFAGRDGEMFKQYCLQTLGIPQGNVHHVKNATLNDMRAEVDWISKVANVYGGDAKIIFYYAGHGVPDEKTRSAFLLPTDGYGNNAETGYKLSDLYAKLSAHPARSILVLLDACFSGSERGDKMLASARGIAIKAKADVPTGNMVVFSAASGDESAYPYREKNHGMFTYFLLKKLQESRGETTLGELADFISKQVSRRSIVDNAKSQTPTITAYPKLGEQWKNWKLK